MKECELCSYPARMYCEADRASLCWDCDQKVHCANFLVAKHSRSLLCHVCQSLTSWKASGPKLGHTVSACEACVDNCERNQERVPEGNQESRAGNEHEEENDLDDDDDDDDDGGTYEDEDGEYVDGYEDEDGENQVVPWSSTPPPPPQPPTASSSSSSEISSSRFSASRGAISSLKRMRENEDLDSEDDISLSSRFNHDTTAVAMSSRASENDEAASWSSFIPLKARRTYELNRSERVEDRRCEAESSCAAIFSSLKKFQQNMISDASNASATILGICELSRDVSTNPNQSG
ncbi:hypothetical protein F0562_010236 [Nyssa sinensis]|uniref:B box-type domain-containing protein n=1 Tax=Nyssa sinensis TaxID=561372 RepID=A0A5J4ZYA7_9ASTE|nr:hypothetical protein F0562_010236 [Nyssa sinensis]